MSQATETKPYGFVATATEGLMGLSRVRQSDERRPSRLERAPRDPQAVGIGVAIGAAAALLVEDGSSVALDASTNSLFLARALAGRGGWSQLTVITSGLRIALELAGHPGIAVAVPGGLVQFPVLSLAGGLGEGFFGSANVHTAFVGAAGLTLRSGLADATPEEAEIKRSMVAAARNVVALVDHTAWGRTAFATFCLTQRISRIVTDWGAPSALVRELESRGVAVHLVGPRHADERSEASLRDLSTAH